MWEVYDYQTVPVVGVTFANKDGEQRQKIIEELEERYGRDLLIAEVELRKTTYKGEPAISVYIDEKQVGFLQKDLAAELHELQTEEGLKVIVRSAYIVGGEEVDYGDEDEEVIEILNYGLRLNIEIGKNVKEYKDSCSTYKTSGKTTRKKSSASQGNVVRIKKAEKRKTQPKGILRFVFGGIYVLYGLLNFGRDTAQMAASLVIGFSLLLWGFSAYLKYKDSLNDKEK